MENESESFIQRALQGIAEDLHTGLAVIYAHYHQRFLAKALTMLCSEEDAKDAVQEMWISVYQDLLNNFTAQRIASLHLEGWLYTILIHKIKRVLAQKDRVHPVSESLTKELYMAIEDRQCHEPENVVLLAEKYEQILQAINVLPERPRTVVLLRYIAEYSIEEIATRLALPKGTVKSLLSRARPVVQQEIRRIVEKER